MLESSPRSSRLSRVVFAVGGMLLPGCQKRESEPASSGPTQVKAAAQETPGALTMKLDDPRVALDFLEQSGLKPRELNEDCALLAEGHEALGALVRDARRDATTQSIQCEPNTGSKTWSCKADFMNSGGEQSEVTDFALSLRFNVDDTSRAIQPESLVCLMAG